MYLMLQSSSIIHTSLATSDIDIAVHHFFSKLLLYRLLIRRNELRLNTKIKRWHEINRFVNILPTREMFSHQETYHHDCETQCPSDNPAYQTDVKCSLSIESSNENGHQSRSKPFSKIIENTNKSICTTPQVWKANVCQYWPLQWHRHHN